MIIIFPCKVETTKAPREGAARGKRAPAGVYLPYTFTISKKYPHTHKKIHMFILFYLYEENGIKTRNFHYLPE